MKSNPDFGGLLRELRTARGLSVERLAAEAGLAPSTLRRWERGTYLPRVLELTALLEALEATPEQQAYAFQRIGKPRFVRHLRQEAAKDKATGWLSQHLPTTGDLWRALRVRRGLPAHALARKLRLSSAQVSRWEKGEQTPPEELLPVLFAHLDARPEERAALTSGHLFSKASADSSNSLLAFELQQAALIGRTLVGEDFPGDLCFLAHEADLWPYAIKDHAMRGLLLRAYEMHADWLIRQARDGEGGRYALRALELVEPGRERPNPHWFGAVWKAANHTARRRGHRAAANLIHSWTRVTDDPGFLSWLYRDQAVHTAAGDMGAALSLIVQARELADRSEHFETQHCGQYVHAQLLLAAGRPAEALSVLPQPRSTQDDALMSAKNLLLWSQVLFALGERGDANDWLGRFYELVEQFNFDHLRPEGDALARRL